MPKFSELPSRSPLKLEGIDRSPLAQGLEPLELLGFGQFQAMALETQPPELCKVARRDEPMPQAEEQLGPMEPKPTGAAMERIGLTTHQLTERWEGELGSILATARLGKQDLPGRPEIPASRDCAAHRLRAQGGWRLARRAQAIAGAGSQELQVPQGESEHFRLEQQGKLGAPGLQPLNHSDLGITLPGFAWNSHQITDLDRSRGRAATGPRQAFSLPD